MTTPPDASLARSSARALLDLPPDHAYGVTGRRFDRVAGRRPFRHPTDLIGWVAPPHWAAVGLVVEGVVCGEADRTTRLALVVDRRGAVELAATTPGRGVSPIDGSARVAGPIVDLCHRVLGVASPPEPATVAALVNAVWLDRSVAEAAAPAAPLGWDDLATLHPLASTDGSNGPLDLAERAVGLARRVPWSTLRARCASGRLDVASLTPAQARWHDDASFARHVLGRFPDHAESIAALRTLVAEHLLPPILAAVRRSEPIAAPGPAGDASVHEVNLW